MFCEKCGRPVEDGQLLCSSCAAEEPSVVQEEAAAPAAEPAFDTFELNTAELNTAEEAPVKKASKKKKGLIAGISALVVAAGIAVCFIFNVGNIVGTVKGFIGRTFQSPEDYLASVEGDAIEQYASDFTQSYGTMLDIYSASPELTGAATTEIRLTLGDDVLSVAESTLKQQGMDMDLDWINKIKLSLDANTQESAVQTILGLAVGNTDIVSADIILDTEENVFYIGVPALNSTYLAGDLSSQMGGVSFRDTFTQGMEMADAFVKAMPSEEEMNTLIVTYAEIILSCIDDVEKETQTIEVGDASQKMVVLTAKITQKDLINIAEKVLKKAENDKTLKKVITSLGDFANEVNQENYPYYEPIDLYAEFQNAIPEMLESIESAKDEADNSNYIKLNVYVDMQNVIRGHAVTVYSDGEKAMDTISWLTAAKGDTVYTEAELAQVKITGEKVTKKGVSTGEYTLKAMGEEICTLEFENMTETSGTLRLVPGEALMEQILSAGDIPSFLSSKIGLELSYNLGEAQTELGLKLINGSKTLIGLDMTSKLYKGGKITIPSNAVDITNEYAVMEWAQNLNFSKLLQALKDSEIPSEIVDRLDQSIPAIPNY